MKSAYSGTLTLVVPLVARTTTEKRMANVPSLPDTTDGCGAPWMVSVSPLAAEARS